MVAVGGQSNDFPPGQCTYWASERYHELTGLYVPWSGNAQDWAMNAPSYGWSVSSSPIAPSIICLQADTQGAGALGHVGVVESVSNGQAVTSNLNWQPTPGIVTSVTHQAGPGVSFIYASGAGGTPLFQFTNFGATIQQALQNSPVQLGPNPDVTSFLYEMDRILDLVNPFAVNSYPTSKGPEPIPTDTALGISFLDPLAWIEGFGTNIIGDLTALILRSAFILVGIIVLYKVMSHFLDLGAVGSNLQQLGGLVGL